ncbi:MAG: peptidase caspase catalytic subunit p20 [Thermomicrobiales bacterium]|jgi:hypothetical protein|nr:peptidase caspase catalytic subunit p20 [Thermomicrobiales bacterium]
MLKRSLHVGLNYPGTSAELAGCVNDAYDWAAMFAELGYEPTISIEPSGDAILTALRDGLDGMRWGDRFVFTYSGHGSFVPDRNGDEIDGFDEVLCPSDYTRRYITDDELATAFDSAATGVRRTFLSDSCHSGSVSRVAGLGFGGSLPPIRARFMSPIELIGSDPLVTMSRGWVQPKASRVPATLISGCSDREYSYDAWFGDRANGAFTRVAIDAYSPGDTMIRWFRAIRSGLPTASFPQTPHLTARLHQRYWKL